MKNRLYRLTCVAALLFIVGSATSQAIPIYQMDGGFLVGIRNVEIEGNLYDVRFRDGVLEDIFDLTDPSVFSAFPDANQASLALSLLLVDVPEGNFGSMPSLVFGCEGDNCHIYTPSGIDTFSGNVLVEWFRHHSDPLERERGSGELEPSYDSIRQGGVIADWTVVPEPATLGLIGLGLAGLVARRSRKGLN